MQSTNQRRLLPPGNPGTTCPLRLFQTFLPSPVLSPPSPASGRTRRTSFSIFFPLNLSFFPLFSFLFSFCASFFFFFPPSDVVGLRDPRRTKSRKTLESWDFPFPESGRELSRVPLELRSGAAGLALSRVLSPSCPGSLGLGGRARGWRCPGGVRPRRGLGWQRRLPSARSP